MTMFTRIQFIIFGLYCLIIFSCKHEIKLHEKLIGSWEVDTVYTSDSEKISESYELGMLIVAMLSGDSSFSDLFSFKISFTDKDTFSVTDKNDNNFQDGTYNLESNRYLILKFRNDPEQKFEVIDAKNNSMLLKLYNEPIFYRLRRLSPFKNPE